MACFQFIVTGFECGFEVLGEGFAEAEQFANAVTTMTLYGRFERFWRVKLVDGDAEALARGDLLDRGPGRKQPLRV